MSGYRVFSWIALFLAFVSLIGFVSHETMQWHWLVVGGMCLMHAYLLRRLDGNRE